MIEASLAEQLSGSPAELLARSRAQRAAALDVLAAVPPGRAAPNRAMAHDGANAMNRIGPDCPAGPATAADHWPAPGAPGAISRTSQVSGQVPEA